MGSVISHNDEEDLDEASSSAIDNISGADNQSNPSLSNKRSKRRRSSHDGCSFDDDANSSKLFKLDTTPHVFKKLFIESCYSDVIINALGQQWRLHRVYLEQCDYFKALFYGNWTDSLKNEYNLEIIDKNVTYFGLFFNNCISVICLLNF